MSAEARSQHIPKEVALKLLEDSRYRCCLCRVLIDTQRYDADARFSSLEEHHIILFSEGGGHTDDNLLLVCANCHSQVHKHPGKYPVDELREKKRHWVRMRDVVPPDLRMIDETDDTIQVPFSVLSLNLQYSIAASPQATVGELALFVGEQILKPLGEYDGRESWLDPDKVNLARRSVPHKDLDSKLRLGELDLAPDDVLTGRVPKIVTPVFIPGRLLERRHPLEPELVYVPAGKFWMGSDRLALELAGVQWHYGMDDETPRRLAHLPAYAIGRTPVTNAEYARFVEGGGYRNRDYWTRAGWEWREGEHRTEPGLWRDEEYNGRSQPVVGVTWYEALAYCKWLTAETGRLCRLPSEAEWEKAARGTDGRIWPWGNGWDAARCNTVENGPGRPTPVGQYSPLGDSPYGCADMAGNVWEWTSSLYTSYRYRPEDLSASEVCVLRGGSWGFNRWFARASDRSWYEADRSSVNIGFRVVMSLAGSGF